MIKATYDDTANQIKEKDSHFPALYINKKGGFIVLFSGLTSGTVVSNKYYKNIHPIGEHIECWINCFDALEWQKFQGQLILENIDK